MIRINLLPVSEKKPSIRMDLYIFLLLLLLGTAALGVLYYRVEGRISDLNAKIENRKKEIASLDGIYREYMSMEKEKKEIQKRLNVVQMIKKGRALPARILYDLTMVTKDTVWLRSLKKTETKITIEGRATENESISDFIEQLSRLPYVKNVELLKVEEVVEEGLPVRKFLVQGDVYL
jgi:type IV pilus assembly protein PilN